MEDKGHFLRHAPCEECGSSDAKAVYSNGTAYCFSCDTWFKGDSTNYSKEGKPKTVSKDLLTNLKFTPLQSRKIREEACRKYGYAYGKTKSKGVVQVANYRDLEGNKVAQHLRTKDKKFSWVGNAKELQLFGQHLWQQGGKRLVITEGEIDCLTIAQTFNLKWAAVSVPNGAPSAAKYIKQNIEFVESFDEVVIAFDSDEQGRDGAEQVAMLLSVGKVKIANFKPFKDANQMLQKGRGGDIANVIFSAKEWRPDGIVAGSDLTLEELKAGEEEAQGYDTPYPKFNEMINGIRKRELVMLTAGTGIGKSTLAKELSYGLVKDHNLKVAHVALEESVKKSALSYLAMDLDVPFGDLYVDRSLVDEEDFDKSHQRLIAGDNLYFYDHFGSLESENLMGKLKYLATGLGVDFIILDHISIVVSGMAMADERKAIDKLMTDLRSLIENTGVGVIAITHLRVPQGKSKAHEEGGRVTLNQLRGSGAIKQLSDIVLAIERNQQGKDRNRSKLRLLKDRLLGRTGVADDLIYNPVTGRLLAVEDEDVKDFKNKEDNNNEEVDLNESPF